MIGRTLAIIGGFVVALAFLLLLLTLFVERNTEKVAKNTIVELNLETSLQEQAPSDALSQLQGRGGTTLIDIVFALEKASLDPKVKGLIVRVGSSPMMPAHAEEIRDAILAFRQSKKFAIAFAEDFDGENSGLTSYYLASACDEIWLQPHSDFGVAGMRFEVPFLRGAFDKLGIAPRFEGRKEFKNAINTYLEKQFTPAHKEAEQRLLDSTFSLMARGVAAGRKLTTEAASEALSRGPYAGEQAVQLHLIDGLAYRDEVYEKAKRRAGKNAKLLWLGAYDGRTDDLHADGKRVALIYGSGDIVSGRSSFDPMNGSESMGSETVSTAFRKAVEDKDVKAIIFRVDSPGGSVVASETIWREVLRARQAKKPVIVSMSSLAASGGYYVAMGADRIIAQPATITGSIGVFTGKMYTRALWDKLGVSFDAVQTGSNAGMYDGYNDFTPDQWAVVRGSLDRIYSNFTRKVAEGRKLPLARVEEIARGRVWSGEDALARGLVDELGGFPAAMRAAKRLAHIPEKEDIELRVYPPAKGRVEALLSLLGLEGEPTSDPQDEAVRSLLREARPAVRVLRQLGVTQRRPGWLHMPPVGVE
ncbi:signal peptide peptidase SppA [uncultured Paludibaculum sp.]|uniref:signal peptide peptidase SppA n=1 Tax=uncultured Paludibaculum sp. TaxID=1765020 RepID=UPI002AAB6704|nr:signal peptide peptidase SppA [uncultured Paludibaculum sp.]